MCFSAITPMVEYALGVCPLLPEATWLELWLPLAALRNLLVPATKMVQGDGPEQLLLLLLLAQGADPMQEVRKQKAT